MSSFKEWFVKNKFNTKEGQTKLYNESFKHTLYPSYIKTFANSWGVSKDVDQKFLINAEKNILAGVGNKTYVPPSFSKLGKNRDIQAVIKSLLAQLSNLTSQSFTVANHTLPDEFNTTSNGRLIMKVGTDGVGKITKENMKHIRNGFSSTRLYRALRSLSKAFSATKACFKKLPTDQIFANNYVKWRKNLYTRALYSNENRFNREKYVRKMTSVAENNAKNIRRKQMDLLDRFGFRKDEMQLEPVYGPSDVTRSLYLTLLKKAEEKIAAEADPERKTNLTDVYDTAKDYAEKKADFDKAIRYLNQITD